jgi:hypothetical protein
MTCEKCSWAFSAVTRAKKLVDEAKQALEYVREDIDLRGPAPFDGKPRLRPHSIPGWWQVWSGGLCIQLLTPEDVAPLRDPEPPRAATAGRRTR